MVNTHHAYLRRALPQLSELTTTILRVHGGDHPELSKVHRLFHMLKMELEQHLIFEVETLFPLVKEYESTGSRETLTQAVAEIDRVEGEHDTAGDIVKELQDVTDDYQAPADGCETYADTYRKLSELEKDLFEHIHLENNILHPRLRQRLEQ